MYNYILVAPSVFLSSLNIVIFLVPPNMGERTELGKTLKLEPQNDVK